MLGKSVGIVGGGLGGLSTAILLARKGYAVTVYEKDALMGGRANQMSIDGFTFDMGPSRYLMPDIFKKFFDSIEEKVEDHLNLIKLDPSYKIFFKDSWENRVVEITGDRTRDQLVFEGIEPGVSNSFLRYMQSSQEQYGIAVNNFLYKNYESWKDFFTREMLFKGYKLSVFTTMASYVKKYFKTDKMQKIIEYPLVFLGTSPYDAPAIYNIMSHVDFNLGVFYPMGGIYEITKALVKIGQKYNVQYRNNAEIQKIFVNPNAAQSKIGKVQGVQLPDGQVINHDIVVVNADMEHAETKLLNPAYQTYPMGYWKQKVMAPSAFILYLGVDKKLTQLRHHNLIFCDDWRKNFEEIFAKPQLPTDPSMYICAPSLTDPSVAPEGKENLFVLVPIAPGLQISPEEEEKYAAHIIRTVSQECDIPNLEKHIIVKKVFHGKDFAQKYNSFKGSALGLAHTLRQTAIFRPKNVSEKVEGLYYVGSYTNPGIGMPMVMISAQLVADRIGV